MGSSESFWDNTLILVTRLSKAMFAQNRSDAEGHIQDLADHFGFDLLKRIPPQQAHEAMIAKRRAEDADDPVSDTERDLKQARANEERDFSVIGGGRV